MHKPARFVKTVLLAFFALLTTGKTADTVFSHSI